MEDLFRTLPKILKEFEDSAQVREAVVFATWKKAAGKSLCDHAVPTSLDEKRLSVAVKDETWKSHLLSFVFTFLITFIHAPLEFATIRHKIATETIQTSLSFVNTGACWPLWIEICSI